MKKKSNRFELFQVQKCQILQNPKVNSIYTKNIKSFYITGTTFTEVLKAALSLCVLLLHRNAERQNSTSMNRSNREQTIVPLKQLHKSENVR